MIIRGKKSGELRFVCNLTSRAKKVYLAGDFNRWNPKNRRMIRCKDGSFRARMRLPAGTHQYKFVVDGVWINDPAAEGQVMNPYGTLNSLINVS